MLGKIGRMQEPLEKGGAATVKVHFSFSISSSAFSAFHTSISTTPQPTMRGISKAHA